MSISAATAIAAAAAVASGVVAGPTHAQAVTGHFTTIADAGEASGSQSAAARLAMAAAAPAMAAAPAIAAGRSKSSARSSAEAPAPAAAATPAATAPATPSTSPTAAPSASSSPAAPEQQLQFYDSITPAAIPAGNVIATYATGKYAVPASAVAGRSTIWIDAWGTDPAASVLDVEPGDATPAIAATWVAQKLAADPSARARLYTMLAEWPAVRAAISGLPSWMQSRVSWWIADPTGVPHMVPGANATQWYWGPSYDISTANPGF